MERLRGARRPGYDSHAGVDRSEPLLTDPIRLLTMSSGIARPFCRHQRARSPVTSDLKSPFTLRSLCENVGGFIRDSGSTSKLTNYVCEAIDYRVCFSGWNFGCSILQRIGV